LSDLHPEEEGRRRRETHDPVRRRSVPARSVGDWRHFGGEATVTPLIVVGVTHAGGRLSTPPLSRRRRRPRMPLAKETALNDPAGFGPDLAEVFGPSQSDGGPELVQLLTPEGERVH